MLIRSATGHIASGSIGNGQSRGSAAGALVSAVDVRPRVSGAVDVIRQLARGRDESGMEA